MKVDAWNAGSNGRPTCLVRRLDCAVRYDCMVLYTCGGNGRRCIPVGIEEMLCREWKEERGYLL